MQPEEFVVQARGPIIQGDADHLRDFIFANMSKGAIVGFAFDSPGGNILEGETIAGMVRMTASAVYILDDSTCASACFLILAAARVKLAGRAALVGVQSASEGDKETLASMGVTTAMARDASAYGVPSAIIGRMVTTEPGQIAWLSPAELTSMGVEFIGQNADTAASPPEAPSALVPAPSSPISTQAPSALVASATPMSLAFLQGKSDRKSWEEWIAGLTPDGHAGAEFWASQRSLPHPTSCQIRSLNQDWAAGCMVAQQKLTPLDARRKSEPDYRAGWNSL